MWKVKDVHETEGVHHDVFIFIVDYISGEGQRYLEYREKGVDNFFPSNALFATTKKIEF